MQPPKFKLWNICDQRFIAAKNIPLFLSVTQHWFSQNIVPVQFTGVIDICGCEIYDGSFVDLGYVTGVVRFGEFEVEDDCASTTTHVIGWYVNVHKQQIDVPLSSDATVIGHRFTHLPDGSQL